MLGAGLLRIVGGRGREMDWATVWSAMDLSAMSGSEVRWVEMAGTGRIVGMKGG